MSTSRQEIQPDSHNSLIVEARALSTATKSDWKFAKVSSVIGKDKFIMPRLAKYWPRNIMSI